MRPQYYGDNGIEAAVISCSLSILGGSSSGEKKCEKAEFISKTVIAVLIRGYLA